MFGVLVAGRLPQQNVLEVEPNKFAIDIEQAQLVDHYVVFMTQPLADGLAVAIHWAWPPYEAWQFIGALSNDKPSGIFRVRRESLAGATLFDPMSGAPLQVTARLGLAIEPAAVVAQQLDASSSVTRAAMRSAPKAATYMEFAFALTRHFYRYAESFAKTIDGIAVLPLNVAQQWLAKIEEKLRRDPDFWRSADI